MRESRATADCLNPWLDGLPSAWGRVPIRWATDPASGLFTDGDWVETPYITDSGVRLLQTGNVGVGRFKEQGFRYISDDSFRVLRCTEVRKGDVLICRLADPVGRACLAPDLGVRMITSVDVAILRPDEHFDARFLVYFFSSAPHLAWVQAVCRGGTRDRVSRSQLGSFDVPAPPLPTQKAIAAFLDRKTAAIDALIEKKQKLLDLLAEKRAALINQAVTKGLDPNVPMKDSGIPWIGQIPAHWEVIKVRRLLDRLDQGWSPVADDRTADIGEWAVLKLSAVSKGVFRPDQHKVLLDDDAPRPELTLHQDDLLITRANTPLLVGDACVVKTRHDRLMLSDLIYRLRFNRRASADYLCLFLISTPGRAPITADARGSSQSMVKVSQGHIKTWPIPVPPYGEQREIASATNDRLARLRSVDSAIRMHIDRLKEYRQALITAAVTGQLDITEDPAA